jgi:hypothetical protein
MWMKGKIAFETYVENARTIFESFPNERVWLQGGLRPNRQLQKPEAGYCIVLRYDERTTNSILRFMAQVRSVLPPVVEYSEQTLHTTIGTYGKGDMAKFILDSATLSHLAKAIENGMQGHYSTNPCVEFGKWLYNEETILVSGYINRDLWHLFQNIENAGRDEGYLLEMGRITHITTARFMSGVTSQEFERFRHLMKSAPIIEPSRPSAIELATWRCDGRQLHLATHKRYNL